MIVHGKSCTILDLAHDDTIRIKHPGSWALFCNSSTISEETSNNWLHGVKLDDEGYTQLECKLQIKQGYISYQSWTSIN